MDGRLCGNYCDARVARVTIRHGTMPFQVISKDLPSEERIVIGRLEIARTRAGSNPSPYIVPIFIWRAQSPAREV